MQLNAELMKNEKVHADGTHRLPALQVDTNSQGAYAADYGTESGYGDGSTADGAYGDYYGQGGQADEAGIGWQDEAAGGKKGRALSIRR